MAVCKAQKHFWGTQWQCVKNRSADSKYSTEIRRQKVDNFCTNTIFFGLNLSHMFFNFKDKKIMQGGGVIAGNHCTQLIQ